jgi:hypothetical protein
MIEHLPHPLPSPPSPSCLFRSLPVRRPSGLLTGEWGRGLRGEPKNKTTRKPSLYKSFNSLPLTISQFLLQVLQGGVRLALQVVEQEERGLVHCSLATELLIYSSRETLVLKSSPFKKKDTVVFAHLMINIIFFYFYFLFYPNQYKYLFQDLTSLWQTLKAEKKVKPPFQIYFYLSDFLKWSKSLYSTV